MKIIVLGAGGVGSYYGGKLALTKNDLFFIARGKRRESLQRAPLMVDSYEGTFSVSVTAVETGASLGVADLILLCVKSYDLVASLDLIEQNVGPTTTIIPFQNGVESEEICIERFGATAVVGGIAFIGTAMKGDRVEHTAHGHIAIGEMDGTADSSRIVTIASLFTGAGIRCSISKDIKRSLSAKMVWNVGFNALSALHDMSANQLAADPYISLEVRGAMLEWIAVAQAMGVPLTESMAQKNSDITLQGGEIIPSMLQDKRQGKRLEVDIFNAYVARMGALCGVATPINTSLAERITTLQPKIM